LSFTVEETPLKPSRPQTAQALNLPLPLGGEAHNIANRLVRGGEELTGGEAGTRRLLELEGRLRMLEQRLEDGDGGIGLRRQVWGVGKKERGRGGGLKKGGGEVNAEERRRALEELLARSQSVGKQVRFQPWAL
jgi:hypothetical protein